MADNADLLNLLIEANCDAPADYLAPILTQDNVREILAWHDERDAAREWARWLRRNGSWPVVGRVLYRLTEFDALDWAAEVEVDRG